MSFFCTFVTISYYFQLLYCSSGGNEQKSYACAVKDTKCGVNS